MSLNETMAAAALDAQTILMDITGEGSFTVSNRAGTFSGVFNEFEEQDMTTPNAIKTVRRLDIKATKAQFPSPPSSAPRASVVAKGVTWTLTGVTDTPLFYFLTCRPVN